MHVCWKVQEKKKNLKPLTFSPKKFQRKMNKFTRSILFIDVIWLLRFWFINFEVKLITEEKTSRSLFEHDIEVFYGWNAFEPNARYLQKHPGTGSPVTLIAALHAIFTEVFYTIGLNVQQLARHVRLLIVFNLWLCNASDRYSQIPESFCMWSRYYNFFGTQYMIRPC